MRAGGRSLSLTEWVVLAVAAEGTTHGFDIARELEERATALGHRDFHAWVGTENYEMRVAEDGSWIDERVLAILRGAK